MKGYIYNLADKGDIFYVGCTVNPYTRLQNHNLKLRCHADKDGIYRPKKHFIGVEMEIIEEIEVADFKDLLPIENYWIYQFKAWGFDLTNKEVRMPKSFFKHHLAF